MGFLDSIEGMAEQAMASQGGANAQVATGLMQTLQEHPEISQLITDLAGKISDEEMQRLNYAVDGQHRDAKDVVHEFLRSKMLTN